MTSLRLILFLRKASCAILMATFCVNIEAGVIPSWIRFVLFEFFAWLTVSGWTGICLLPRSCLCTVGGRTTVSVWFRDLPTKFGRSIGRKSDPAKFEIRGDGRSVVRISTTVSWLSGFSVVVRGSSGVPLLRDGVRISSSEYSSGRRNVLTFHLNILFFCYFFLLISWTWKKRVKTGKK